MKIVTSNIMRMLEQNFVSQGGSYLDLMENAGRAVARAVLDEKNYKPVLILCGKGNNGGDGFVTARLLREKGYTVDVILADGMPKTPEANANIKRLPDGVRIFDYHENIEGVLALVGSGYGFVIDALYGIGFRGQLSEDIARLLTACSALPALKIAVDISSGVNCDDGTASSGSFCADKTITFTMPKLAHIVYPAMDFCGELCVADVGIPQKLIDECPYTLHSTESYVQVCPLPRRKSVSHKGTYGHLMCVCGSYGMAGAAVLAGSAALSSGVGLVTMSVPKSIYEICASRLVEATFMPMEQNDDGTLSIEGFNKITYTISDECSAALIGCGLGLNEETSEMVGLLVENLDKPMILDADGINALGTNKDVLKHSKAPVILTPHLGEMARFLEVDISEVKNNILDVAQEVAHNYNVYLVLKDAHTIIASPDGQMLVNLTGCSGMAKGGSGDVLAGLMGGFLAQGMEPMAAATHAVYAHGLAGEYASRSATQRTVRAMKLVEALSSYRII